MLPGPSLFNPSAFTGRSCVLIFGCVSRLFSGHFFVAWNFLHQESEAFLGCSSGGFAPPCLLVTNFGEGPPHLLAHTKKVRKTTLKTKKREKSTPFLRDSLLLCFGKNDQGRKHYRNIITPALSL